jgi:hypothetical protein
MKTTAKHRGAACAALLAFVVFPATVQADHTTAETRSLEWIVRSSDAIYLVRSLRPKQNEGSWSVELERPLREPSNPSESIFKTVEEAELPHGAKDGDQWLVFVRTWKDKPSNVFYWVNLTRPLQRPWTAAINAKGTPLAEKAEILQAVEDRLRLNRHQSDRERACRERVDRRGPSWADRYSLERSLGGFLVRIDCNLWDRPWDADVDYEIYDEDLGLCGIVVPADPEYYEELLQEARRSVGNHPCNRRIANLINYPGPKTDEVLRELTQSKNRSRGVARNVAWYFRYRHDLSDPLHRELVGRWRLLGHRERIDITLNEDATFIATSFDRKSEDESSQLWHGRGHWLLHNKTLSLFRTAQFRALPGQSTDKPCWYSFPRMIFEDKPILSTSPTSVQLKNGPIMKRLGDVNETKEQPESGGRTPKK